MDSYIKVCDIEKYYGNASNVTRAIIYKSEPGFGSHDFHGNT